MNDINSMEGVMSESGSKESGSWFSIVYVGGAFISFWVFLFQIMDHQGFFAACLKFPIAFIKALVWPFFLFF